MQQKAGKIYFRRVRSRIAINSRYLISGKSEIAVFLGNLSLRPRYQPRFSVYQNYRQPNFGKSSPQHRLIPLRENAPRPFRIATFAPYHASVIVGVKFKRNRT